jgi:hypothetical protein
MAYVHGKDTVMPKQKKNVPSSKKIKFGGSWGQIVTSNGHEVLVTTDLRSAIEYARRVVLTQPTAEQSEETNPAAPEDNNKT